DDAGEARLGAQHGCDRALRYELGDARGGDQRERQPDDDAHHLLAREMRGARQMLMILAPSVNRDRHRYGHENEKRRQHHSSPPVTRALPIGSSGTNRISWRATSPETSGSGRLARIRSVTKSGPSNGISQIRRR